MSANTISRETARDALATLLSSALVGTGKPCQQVLNYRPADFGNQVPAVCVLSSGVQARKQFGLGTVKYRTWFRYELLVFVPEASTVDVWTRQDAEDKIDAIEKAIADVIADNRSSVNWEYLEHAEGGSSIVPAQVGGNKYMMEDIVVIAEVVDA